ncbi:hypothetical protein I3000191B1_26410 [Flavonifractor plautii]
MPPAGPFLNGQKGAKEPAGKGGFRFPPFPAPIPLKTTKEGASGPPSLESPPKLFYRLPSGGGGLLRNVPAAPAYMGGNRETVLERRGGARPRSQMVPPHRDRRPRAAFLAPLA